MECHHDGGILNINVLSIFFKSKYIPSIPSILPASTAEAPDLVLFKQGLSNLTF